MQVNLMTEGNEFYMFIEEEVAGHIIRMGMNSLCASLEDVEAYMGDVIPDARERGLEYAVEVDFSVDGLADYGNAAEARVSITRWLLKAYRVLINEMKIHVECKPVLMFCTPYESDGMMDYRIKVYQKFGYTFWQCDVDENTNCLWKLA